MPWLGFTYHYGFTGRVLGRLVCAHSQKNITSSWVDLKVVGNFAGECSVSTAPWQGSSLFFSFKGSLTLRDRFQLSNILPRLTPPPHENPPPPPQVNARDPSLFYLEDFVDPVVRGPVPNPVPPT